MGPPELFFAIAAAATADQPPARPVGGAHAAVLQLGRGPSDHRHRDLRRGRPGRRALLQTRRCQLRAQRRLRGQPRHTRTG